MRNVADFASPKLEDYLQHQSKLPPDIIAEIERFLIVSLYAFYFYPISKIFVCWLSTRCHKSLYIKQREMIDVKEDSLEYTRAVTKIYDKLQSEYQTLWEKLCFSFPRHIRAAKINSMIQTARETLFEAIFHSNYTHEILGIQKCSRCKRNTLGDIRYLRLACFYEMAEYPISALRATSDGYYMIGICKRCRGDWLQSLVSWFHTPTAEIIDGDCISCAVLGSTSMYNEGQDGTTVAESR